MAKDHFGLDAANSSIKIKTMNEVESYLNTYREIGKFESSLVTSNDLAVGYQGKYYITGVPEGRPMIDRGSDRYSTEDFHLSTILALAKHVENNQKVKLVIGLPSEHFKKEQCHKDIKDFLEGQEFTVEYQGEVKRFKIAALHILLQPLGSLMYRLYDDRGHLRNGREAEKGGKLLVVDIGFGTTDIVEVTRLMPTKIEGVNIGMQNAIAYLRENLIRDYKDIAGLPIGLELDALVRDTNNISVGGGGYSINAQRDEAFDKATKDILAAIKALGFNLESYDKVLFTGGGVIALAPYLSAPLKGLNAARLTEGQLANVKGFYTYGVMKL